MKKIYTADFETSTLKWYSVDKEARVWAYALCNVYDTTDFIYGNNIDDFMKFCMDKKNKVYNYFFYPYKIS